MNHLKSAKSLYLKQHQDNPVHWHEWSQDTLAKAEKENKPILLSIGYSSCHWCHVMAHESFEDAETADLMNTHFINIKLDREEHPDIDHLYQQALSLMGEPGGWPLTMFLDAKGQAFFGGTYFPPKPMHGRPSFKTILKGVADSWSNEQDTIHYNVSAIKQALKEESKPKPGDLPDQKILDQSFQNMITGFDPKHGGFGSAPKFPQVPLMNALWQHSLQATDDIYRKACLVTFDNICQGGLYDHLGGGFFRYSTDEKWLVPHFEKMLYDNALLIDLLTSAYHHTQNDLYKTRIFETVDWLLSDMKLESNDGFAAAIDADNTEGEGAFYTWLPHEIDDILGIDALNFKKTYGVPLNMNDDQMIILNRLATPALFNDKKESALKSQRHKLKNVRDQRDHPVRDNKILTDWNAMTITALAKAAIIFDQPEWQDQAIKTYQFLKSNLDRDGQLYHCYIEGDVTTPAILDDYAWMMMASLTLYQHTSKDEYLKDTAEFYTAIKQRFSDKAQPGYCMSDDHHCPIPSPVKTINDTAIPAGNAVLLRTLIDWHDIDPSSDLKSEIETLITTFAGEISLAPYAMGGYLHAVQKYLQL